MNYSSLSHFLCFFLCLFLLLLFTFSWLPTPIPPSTSPDHLLAHPKPTQAYALPATPSHPLDPLTISEITTIRSILISEPPFSSSPSSLIFHSLSLDPPDKDVVLSWSSGDPLPPRSAYAVVRFNRKAHSLSIDLSTGTISSLPNPVSGFPTMTIEDMTSSALAPLSDPAFNRSVIARGVRTSDLACLPVSSGWFGREIENERRLIKVQCYSIEGTANFYMRPIEGLTVLVDMDTKEVVKITDEGGNIPIPKSAGTDYRYEELRGSNEKGRPLRPISIEQPEGPSFEVVDGHRVKWAGWEFHLKADARAGLVVSAATVADPITGKRRSVLYKGFASELFVPYMDPTDAWYFKTYMDAGEYGFGLQAMPLVPLNDCPRNAYYMDGTFVAADGRPYVRKNMICVYESYAGDIGWRHSESPITGLEIKEVRPKVTLVARMAASVANYDYIVDWEFQTDGIIRVKVGLSGILMVKGSPYTHISQFPSKQDTYGTLLSENIIGVIHDHFITFHLDLDIDGANNSFVKVQLSRQGTDSDATPRRSYLKATRHIAQTEKDAQIKLKLYEPYEFHVINSDMITRVGNPVGYKVVPAGTAAALLDLKDPPQIRGAFTNNQIWVTPRDKKEEWAGGLFVYQNKGEDTLAVWSERDRPIENKDIVLWYTLGFHHIPCQEDFPIMPIVSSSFDLKPVNFFERNPILTAAPNQEKDLPVCTPAASS